MRACACTHACTHRHNHTQRAHSVRGNPSTQWRYHWALQSTGLREHNSLRPIGITMKSSCQARRSDAVERGQKAVARAIHYGVIYGEHLNPYLLPHDHEECCGCAAARPQHQESCIRMIRVLLNVWCGVLCSLMAQEMRVPFVSRYPCSRALLVDAFANNAFVYRVFL